MEHVLILFKVGQSDWKTCLQTILSQEAAFEPETHGADLVATDDQWINSFLAIQRFIRTSKFSGLYSVNLTDASESLLVEINETGSKVRSKFKRRPYCTN